MKLNKQDLSMLLGDVNKIFTAEPNFLKLPSDNPIIFIGDTHGDIQTTSKILSTYSKFLLVFLGDYVDREPNIAGSLQNIVALLLAKRRNPDKIILLRGNHEFASTFDNYDFGDELKSFFPELKRQFETVFSNLPYIATTENGVLALHGGLPHFSEQNQLKNIPKGIIDSRLDNLVCQLVWNDHFESSNPDEYIQPSPRDEDITSVFRYSKRFFEEKMAILHSNLLVRGHDPNAKGYAFENRLLTIFTSESYRNMGKLKGVYVARLDPDKAIINAKDLELLQIQ